MKKVSPSAVRAAWHKAKVDADAVEATALGRVEARGEYAESAAGFLQHFRNEEYAEQIGQAWLEIEGYCRGSDDGKRVIKCAMDAAILSDYHDLKGDYERSKQQIEALNEAAGKLYAFFTDTIERDPDFKIISDTGRPFRTHDISDYELGHAVHSLKWMQSVLKSRLKDYFRTYADAGLSRKDQGLDGRRVRFTVAMSDGMLSIFDRPLDNVVRLLAEVFFKEPLTIDQIKHARVAAANRRTATGQQSAG